MSAAKIRLRYVGGIPLTVYLASGRTITVEPGEVYEFLPAEEAALRGRPDYEPDTPDTPTPEEA